MTTHEVISSDKDKGFHQKFFPAVQKIILETAWTDYLQNLVDFGNKCLLRNFSLRLEMDDDESEMHRQCVYPEKEVNQ
jgi:hypothetical protein